MSPRDEDLIATYARRPDELAPDERAHVEALISNDAAAAQIFEFFAVYYEEFDALQDKSLPQVDQFIRERTSEPRIIELSLVTPPAEGTPSHEEPEFNGETRRADAFVLASEADELVVNIYGSHAGKSYDVHVSAGADEMRSHALLSLPEADVRIKLDAAGRGTLCLSDDSLPLSADLLRNAALYPVRQLRTLEFGSFDAEPAELLPGLRLRIEAAGVVRWMPPLDADAAEIRFVAIEWPGHQHVIESTQREAVIPIDEPSQEFTVALYG